MPRFFNPAPSQDPTLEEKRKSIHTFEDRANEGDRKSALSAAKLLANEAKTKNGKEKEELLVAITYYCEVALGHTYIENARLLKAMTQANPGINFEKILVRFSSYNLQRKISADSRKNPSEKILSELELEFDTKPSGSLAHTIAALYLSLSDLAASIKWFARGLLLMEKGPESFTHLLIRGTLPTTKIFTENEVRNIAERCYQDHNLPIINDPFFDELRTQEENACETLFSIHETNNYAYQIAQSYLLQPIISHYDTSQWIKWMMRALLLEESHEKRCHYTEELIRKMQPKTDEELQQETSQPYLEVQEHVAKTYPQLLQHLPNLYPLLQKEFVTNFQKLPQQLRQQLVTLQQNFDRPLNTEIIDLAKKYYELHGLEIIDDPFLCKPKIGSVRQTISIPIP